MKDSLNMCLTAAKSEHHVLQQQQKENHINMSQDLQDKLERDLGLLVQC